MCVCVSVVVVVRDVLFCVVFGHTAETLPNVPQQRPVPRSFWSRPARAQTAFDECKYHLSNALEKRVLRTFWARVK